MGLNLAMLVIQSGKVTVCCGSKYGKAGNFSLETGPNRELIVGSSKNQPRYIFLSDGMFRELPWQAAGVAIPMFSVRSESDLGVGEFLDLKLLVHWAVDSGFHLVQLLPINDTSVHGMWWDSYPYRYSGSVAAMSMVGHILGLGDRHLDNILIDFSKGDVVHIDYNVCFDKGQRLKVPELVSFRLTQTIEAALGLTGIEGTFRSSCEAVVDVLRKNKDILLMLLEVFVWDPLEEWTRGDYHDDAAIGGEERKGMELVVSLSLFASRVQEIRVPLQVCII
ncbi:hypothetical protein ACB092_03G192800 [Castanea dentata]